MLCKASISYESETKPVHTVRVEFSAKTAKQALRQATREAIKNWPSRQSYTSWVICVEQLVEEEK